jgi:hypothetical protein
LLDKEVWDAYITQIEAVDPEQAASLQSFYDHMAIEDDEDLAEMMLEALEEHGLAHDLTPE